MKNSFSFGVREELCGLEIESRHCALAELAAFLVNTCEISRDEILMHTEHLFINTRYEKLLNYIFTEDVTVKKVLSAAGVTGGTVDELVLMSSCCKRAYIRGCLITGGALSNPQRNYHLEFGFPAKRGEELAKQLKKILEAFEINAKTRGGHSLVYLKEAENIVEVLRLTGASKALLQIESTRITKEIANEINRKVNFETANLNKTVSAAVSQLNDIKFIEEKVGLGYLSKPLEDAARLRLEFQTASLQEIGKKLESPVSKSGVNHRLRKISEIAEALKKENKIESTHD